MLPLKRELNLAGLEKSDIGHILHLLQTSYSGGILEALLNDLLSFWGVCWLPIPPPLASPLLVELPRTHLISVLFC